MTIRERQSVHFERPVDLDAVRDIQQAMREDLAWRRAGGPLRLKGRIHFGVTFDSLPARLAAMRRDSTQERRTHEHHAC